MEKELTEYEALAALSQEDAKRSQEIMDRWKNKKMSGRDGGYTQELNELHKTGGKRYCKLKELYKEHKTLPESEVMEIIMGNV